ncbi:P-loop containing nucleoside triphosphate hydrolase protein [Violaceomyces palustris]|uniref:P-loop containing nucleoside triphosphate hydrolase protein n=1 Tax=Violaceomyces palustris TaxID=1673888 RepID=A0ACD0NTJ2_9BASI|nr:P-loop containing nucleoside triphosphate hydrolase protein [Violaceomyces palustris]
MAAHISSGCSTRQGLKSNLPSEPTESELPAAAPFPSDQSILLSPTSSSDGGSLTEVKSKGKGRQGKAARTGFDQAAADFGASSKRRRSLGSPASSLLASKANGSEPWEEKDEFDWDQVELEPSAGSKVKKEPQVIELSSDSEDEVVCLSGPPNTVLQSEPPVSPRAPPPPPPLPRTPTRPRGNQKPRSSRTTLPESVSLAESDLATTSSHQAHQQGASTADSLGETEGIPDFQVLKRDSEWPDHFVKLEQTFKAINTVYSFCSARKHMATTFNTIKSSVEGLTKRPLEIFDIAQIKSLCGDLINFAYVEQDMLELLIDGGRDGNGQGGASYKGNAKSRQLERDEVYERAAAAIGFASSSGEIDLDASGFETSGGGWQDSAESSSTAPPSGPLLPPADFGETGKPSTRRASSKDSEYILFFEFNDGTLLGGPKATRRTRPGLRRGPSRAPPPNPRRAASKPSLKGMRKLIDKRNFKFEQAVLELLQACKAKDEDPVQLLVDAAHDHVPLDPSTAQRPDGETPKKKRIRLEFLMQNPDHRPRICDIIEEMKGMPWYKDQIVPGGHRQVEARDAKYSQLNYQLSQAIVNALYATTGIEEFYVHQAEALNALHDGSSVIICTSTSSGKSLIYQLPVLQSLEEDPESTALFIFPTKALAQDQRRSLQDLLHNFEGLEDTVVATYDGDTDNLLRRDIRERASVIFTNPDMLHQSILPSEELWRRYLRNLRYVVVDELHTYNGLFGAHVSFIMRRLRRICSALGNTSVQFVCCSATVANPKEHMQTIFGVEDVQVITEDGSPAGSKEWLVWNPPLIDEADPAQGRVSAYAEVSKVFRHLIQRGVRTIIFTKVRRTCEIVMRQVRSDLLLEDRHDVASKVMSYRSGYSPQDRRKIEQDMFKGQLLGIVATSALELGIDIGSLDAVIMLGFPYSISSLRQQAGRAGRRQKDSLAVLIGDPFPMDQHYMRFPDEIFSQPDTALSVDLTNDFVLESHLQCAAEEMPISIEDDTPFFGDHLASLCKTRLVDDGSGFFHCRSELRPNPSRDVAIRGARQVTYSYVDDTPGRRGGPKVMEEVEIERAIFEAFEGAVFMHQGLSFICKDLSHDTRIARMVRADVNYHTRPRDHTDTDAMETYRIRRLRGSPYLAYYGKVTITSYVWGYFKVDKRANILDAVEVDCPPFVRHTQGLWLDIPLWIIEALTDKMVNAAAAIHAAEHALLSLTPMFVVSLAGDVMTECKIAEKEYSRRPSKRKRPARLIFYDNPGQNGGICVKAFEHLDSLIRIAISVIESCRCSNGCPSCVTSVTCAHANLVTSKIGALAVLRGILGREPFDPDVPVQNEAGISSQSLTTAESLNHTISQAQPVRSSGEVLVEEVQEALPTALEALGRLVSSSSSSIHLHPSDPQAQAGTEQALNARRFLTGKSLLFTE